MSLESILAVVNFARAKKAATDKKPTRIKARTAEKIVLPNFFLLRGFFEPKRSFQFLLEFLVIASAPK
ncbi:MULTISPECIES: hypothetical protein [Acidaminococcus]|nr:MULTISPECIES: hypothetical protein [Acidaminococcus]